MKYDYEDQFKEALEKLSDNNLKKKLVSIKKLVVERMNLEIEFKKEHNLLECKYDEFYKPIYEKRKKIIDGELYPNLDEIKDKMEELKITEKDLSANQNEKGIPEFWAKCLENSPDIELNDKDKKILKKLKDISCENKANGNFILTFTFEPNEYFKPEILTKEFILDQEMEIKQIVSTKIEWSNDENNPTMELKKKKMKNKKTKEFKIVTKKEEVPSFFSGFKNFEKKEASGDKDKDNENEEDEEEDENVKLEDEYDLGLQFKEEIIPFAIEYYLGVCDTRDEDDEEEEEEEDDDDDEDEVEKPKPGKGKRNHH